MIKLYVLVCLTVLLETVSTDTILSHYRLPRNFLPTHYGVVIIPDYEKLTFQGKIDINFAPAANITKGTTLDRLELNSYSLKIDEYSVVLKEDDKEIEVGMVGLYPEFEKLLVVPVKPFKLKATYSLHLEYTGVITVATNYSNNVGLVLSTYNDDKGNKWKYLIGNLFPVYARYVFPCFDEPYFKATFQLTLARPVHYSSISNTLVLETFKKTDAHHKVMAYDVFRKTPRMASSSLGLLTSQMSRVEDTNGRVNILAPSNEYAEKISNISYWKNIFKLSEKFTNNNYKLPFINFVFIPHLFQNFITSWGIVYVKANKLFYQLDNPGSETTILKSVKESQFFEISFAKAVMTQFYGDEVSPEYWDEIWLRDSISEYFASSLAAQLSKMWDFNEYMSSYTQPSVLRYQSISHSPPVVENCTEKSIQQQIASITTQQSSQGTAVLFMLNHSLDKGIFEEPLKQYFSDNLLQGYGTSQDLITLWQKQLDKYKKKLPYNLSISKIMQTWLHNEGVPLILVERIAGQNTGTQTLKISQTRSTASDHELNSKEDKEWYIPLQYSTGNNGEVVNNPVLWFGPYTVKNITHHTLEITDAISEQEWFVFNTKATGLYSIKYDNYNYQLLKNQLMVNPYAISVENRAQITSDLFLLMWDGHVTYQQGFAVLEYLQNETEYYPWLWATKGLQKLHIMLLSTETELFNQFQNFIRTSISKVYKVVSFEEKPNEKYTDILLRANVLEWACDLDIGDCVAKATDLMNQILKDDSNSLVRYDYLYTVFCGGLQNADLQTWDKVYKLFRQKRDLTNEGYLLFTLGCTRNSSIVDQFLTMITVSKDDKNNTLSADEAFIIFHSVTTNGYEDKALSFLVENALTIEKTYGEDTLSLMVRSISPFLTTLSQRNQINELSKLQIGNEALLAVNGSVVRADNNIQLLKRITTELQLYFNDQSASTTTTPQPTTPSSACSLTYSFTTFVITYNFIKIINRLNYN